ncbi:L,D-transpeptidase [Actinomycetospora soli]|uniref:L,D-transpeptidase n=1 Tax=Actinomycetospora soli TaxID=2893887 RepID=UPI001E42D739|nr:L,D-transpeptidase [Actinomycetospora soli]MCD2188914.1 L,D-transpeptidase [Actinomycetospora soli]
MRKAGIGMAGSAVLVLGALGVTTGLGPADLGGERPAAVAAAAGPAAPLATVPPVLPAPAAASAGVTTRPATSATSTTTSTPKPTSSRTARTTTARTGRDPSSGMPCSISGDGACVSLSAKRAWLVQDGEVVRSAPITSGRPGERTPTGTFHVTWKDADHRSSQFDDAPMPWSVFFNGGIAFHTGSLSRQSAGCIHLSDAVARQFFRTLAVGDTVVVVK